MVPMGHPDCNSMADFGLRKNFAEEIAMTIARKVLVNPTVTPL